MNKLKKLATRTKEAFAGFSDHVKCLLTGLSAILGLSSVLVLCAVFPFVAFLIGLLMMLAFIGVMSYLFGYIIRDGWNDGWNK